MTQTQRRLAAGISTSTLAKLSKAAVAFVALILVALLPGAATARTVEVQSRGTSPYLDTEVFTNIVMHLSRNDTRNLRARFQLAGTPSNSLEIAFGRDANTNGALDAGEAETVYGWRGGRYIIEDVRGWNRHETQPDGNASDSAADILISNDKNLAPKRFAAPCGGFAAFAELSVRPPPSWLFRESWNMMRVTRRGFGAVSDWVRCDIEYKFFTVILR